MFIRVLCGIIHIDGRNLIVLHLILTSIRYFLLESSEPSDGRMPIQRSVVAIPQLSLNSMKCMGRQSKFNKPLTLHIIFVKPHFPFLLFTDTYIPWFLLNLWAHIVLQIRISIFVIAKLIVTSSLYQWHFHIPVPWHWIINTMIPRYMYRKCKN